MGERRHIRIRARREHVALALSLVALFVVLGGPSYAASVIDGSTIKPKSITGKQLASGAVALATIDPAARAKLKGPTGSRGAQGLTGQPGPAGARGGTGAPVKYDVYDSAGRRIGRDAGNFTSYQLVLTDGGALLPYTADTTSNVPVPFGPSTLYYKGSACEASTGPAGNRTPYLVMAGTPAQMAAIQDSPPVIGSTIYVQQQVAPETISVGSAKSSGTCSGSSGTITVVAARIAGTVPSVQKPLVLKAVG